MRWGHILKIAALLDERRGWMYRGAFHLRLTPDGDWTLGISGDSASRIRLDACHLGIVRATRWVREDDSARLAAVVLGIRDEVGASSGELV
jgi:hypothetical protein